jgi:SAM-dependent methyltransferase
MNRLHRAVPHNAGVDSTAGPPRYDAFAELYERHATDSAYNALYDRPAVLQLLGDVQGQRVLDAGCGPGLYAVEMLARGAKVVAFDQSPEMVRLARQRLGERVDVRVHDLASPLDWVPSESFDAAVLALVIHHLDDRMVALRELNRAVRPGGRLIVSTHHPTSDWLRLGGSYFSTEPVEEDWHEGQWHVRYWRQPLSKTCAEFADAGFLVERIEEPLPSPEMAERFPDDFAKLSQEPGFLVFRLLKPSVAVPR